MTVPETSRRRGGDAVAHAVATLRSMIVSGEIAPGTELSQTGLAVELGVSTTPLREALHRLEAEGLIETRRNRGPRVPPFDVEDLDAVYCNRVLLESLAASLAVPRSTPQDVEALRTGLAAMDDATSAGDVGAWDAAHAAFHRRLVATGNPALDMQIAALVARSARYRRLSVLGDQPEGRQVGAAEHAAITAAAEARDGSRTALLLARHLTRSALTLAAHLAPDADPVAVRTGLQLVMAWADR